jgi:plasmid stabilization system protein ParE
MARVLYTPSAETDLLDAWLFIAEEDPIAADRMLDTIDCEANTLSSQPRMGRARPELGEGVRSWPTATPYILFYTSEGEDLIVLRVLHHAREVQRFAAI